MIQLKAFSIVVLFCGLTNVGLATAAPIAASVVDVIGWPVPELTQEAPPIEMGDDPVYGRQICPPLTRLNLADKKSEELLLKRVSVERGGGGTIWHYELRQGLFWWDGEAVTAAALSKYIQAQLEAVVRARSRGVWKTPEFELLPAGEQSIKVRFKHEPAFGPYVFNGVPFYRKGDAAKNDGIGFECVGLYRPKIEPFGIALLPTPGYKSKRPLPEVHLYREGQRPQAKVPLHFEIRYASSLSSTPATRPPDVAFSCGHMLDMPNATMIVWNTKSGPAAKPEFRRAMSHLIPRGALVNAGAAAMAEVSSSPVPRQHPGFSPQAASHPFDIRASSLTLNRLGYRRKTSGSPRLDMKGEPLRLVLLSQSKSQGLAEKVILDAFSAVGINTQIKAQLADGEQADGVLAAFALDWPRVSLLGNFHSSVAGAPAPFAGLGDKGLDRSLEQYAASLTTATPDFTLLGAIQRYLVELEPVTVLFQQKACVESGPGFKLARGSITQKDPDWFRQLLF